MLKLKKKKRNRRKIKKKNLWEVKEVIAGMVLASLLHQW